MEGRFVSYLRVSTARQGKSGLGLEAQKEAIHNYLNGGKWKLLNEFVEIESGKRDDNRPQLQAALEVCRRKKATLLIAKLDRLGRNVAFISSLMESGVEFTACDFPTANKLTVHILAAMGQYEREMISKRTSEALKAARVRGVKLGSPVGISYEAQLKGAKHAKAARIRKADRYAKDVYPVIKSYLDEGMSLNGIARQLRVDGELTPRGTGNWTPTAVRNILARIHGEET